MTSWNHLFGSVTGVHLGPDYVPATALAPIYCDLVLRPRCLASPCHDLVYVVYMLGGDEARTLRSLDTVCAALVAGLSPAALVFLVMQGYGPLGAALRAVGVRTCR